MSVTRAPSPPAVDAERPSRRWPRRLILVTGLLLATFLIAAGFAIVHYEPLGWDLTAGTSGVDFEYVETYGDPEVRILRYDHGAEFAYTYGLRNTGPWGVTVTGIETMPPGLESLVVTTEAILLPPGQYEYRDGGVRRLRPFSLAPGEVRVVGVRARFQNCGAQLDSDVVQILASDTIRFRILGISQWMEIPLPPYRLVVGPPPRADCPE